MSETRAAAPLAVDADAGPGSRAAHSSRLISASAVMAAGTLASRVLGFGRLMLLVLLFGNGTRQADMFSFANTVPNSMYILLAGGVLNTVLVPQIVRAIKTDPDGGEAYTNRIMTGGLLVLGVITVALTFAAPLVIRLYTPPGWHQPGRALQYDSMVALAYYCLPQVFFYGVHVLAGQVLNARGRFGPMMWAPIANNVISIVVLLLFVAVYGKGDRFSAFTTGQELLLGLGSTLGIAAQAAVLVPFLRASGYRFRPRWDFRGTGLRHTVRLARWTLGFVLVTQAALVVVYRLAGSATAGGQGGGLTVYTNAYAVWILPHSLITVSLATAMLPAASRMAAAGDRAGVRDETMRTMRLAVTALLPTAVALVALAQPITRLAFGFGRGAPDAHLVGSALTALALGLVPFTVQYVCLRAYYSMEDTRTTFFLQLVISGIHVTLALTVVRLLHSPALVATGLALAYAGAYGVGVLVSFRVLGRRLPGLDGRGLVRHLLRLLAAAAPAGGLAYAVATLLRPESPAGPGSRWTLVLALVAAGVVAVPVFLLLARVLHIAEVEDVLATVRRRGRGRAARPATEAVSGSAAADGDDPGAVGDTTLAVADDDAPTVPMAADDATALLAPAGTPAEPGPGPAPAATLPAGSVLGHRYRLEELLASSAPTVTWRAFDQMLSRSVLVHLLPPGDPAVEQLLVAARQASVAGDSRFLRVLDAVPAEQGEPGSYIVCEYATGQSLELVLSRGPLSSLEAAWVVREVADALSSVHPSGLFHRRINPDTVIITPTGHVKIVGLMIEATLRPGRGGAVPGADRPELVDVTDLGRLLYAALVARWPGGPAYSLPAAPPLGQRWMTPRQVRAGVSPALDAVCDQILGDPPRHRATPLRTADDVVDALTKVLGPADASADLERRLRQPVPRVGTPVAAPVSPLLDQPTATTRRVVPVADDERGLPTERMALADLPDRAERQTPGWPPAPGAARSTAAPSPAAPSPARPDGGPLAGTGSADAGVEAAQTTRIRQPPPPGPRERSRRSGTPRRGATRVVPAGGSRAATDAAGRRPGGRVVVLVLLAALLVTGSLAAFALRGGHPSASAPVATAGPTSVTPTPSASPAPETVPIQGARDFDPQGHPDRENPKLVGFAYDGLPGTRWQTVSYFHNPELGGLKRGVGLVLDLGRAQAVGSVQLSLWGRGTSVEIRVPKADPAQLDAAPLSSDKRWRIVGQQSDAPKSTTLALEPGQVTRFVLVYLTRLPKEGSAYQGGVYEVRVFS